MEPERVRLILVVGMLLCAGLMLVYPLSSEMSADILFDDDVDDRIEQESIGNSTRYGLVLRIVHDDGGKLTSNLSRLQALMKLEQEALDGSNPDTSWEATHVSIERILTPFQIWDEAFAVHNRSLANATQWNEVMQPTIEDGWCGNGSSEEGLAAFEVTMMLLPKNTNFGIACPAFAGASADQPPEANELLWMVWLTGEEEDTDWGELDEWAQKVTKSTEFEVRAVGVNMMFAKAKDIAEHDLLFILPPSIVILGLILTIGLRDPLIAAATLAGVGLVICAELGALAASGYQFSIVDGIAIPIILGVSVDGAFWYCRSSRERDEVRSMLFVAMMTTVAAVSLAMVSPLKAQRSLAKVIVFGIILGWAMTRFVLEDFYLQRRKKNHLIEEEKKTPPHPALAWSWTIALLVLVALAAASPAGVKVLDIEQFLPEGDPAMDELEDLQSKYVLASSTIAWVVLEVEGDSADDLQQVMDFQDQLKYHPSIISIDSGMFRSPLVIGLSNDGEGATIDEYATSTNGSMLMDDARLQKDGITTGVAIAVFIDGKNIDASLIFKDDVENLLATNNLSGGIGGELPTGAELAKKFDETRITQILVAGLAIFFVAHMILNSPIRASRIAIGTVAVGAALDGIASLIGGRGITSSLSVLLGMGFTADYLSHASTEHAPTAMDTSARWWAAITSASAFVLLGIVTFPPAQNTGRLLTIGILISIILATCLSFVGDSSEALDDSH
jgi:predicted RND superfamily exporter protein